MIWIAIRVTLPAGEVLLLRQGELVNLQHWLSTGQLLDLAGEGAQAASNAFNPSSCGGKTCTFPLFSCGLAKLFCCRLKSRWQLYFFKNKALWAGNHFFLHCIIENTSLFYSAAVAALLWTQALLMYYSFKPFFHIFFLQTWEGEKREKRC